MTLFEIHIPGAAPAHRVQRIKAVHWFDALQRCLSRAGQPPLSAGAQCRVNRDESMTVEDTARQRAFRVRTLRPCTPTSRDASELPDPYGLSPLPNAVLKSRETLGYESLSSPPTPVPNPFAAVASKISIALESNIPIGDRLDRLLADLDRRVSSRASAMLLIDPNDRCFYFASGRGDWLDGALRRRLPLESGLLARCLRSRRPLNARDPFTAPGHVGALENLLATRPDGALIVPIMDMHRLYGVLLLIDGEPLDDGNRFFSEQNAMLTRCVGRLLGAHLGGLLPAGSATA